MTQKATKRIRVLKWVLSILFLLAALVIGLSWYASVKLRPILKKEIVALVQQSTQGLYQIEFSAIHTNLITGSAVIKDVKIKPDTAVFRQLVDQKKAPNNLYFISLKQLAVKRFHPLALYFNKTAEIDLLLFDKPAVTMVNRHFDFNDHRPPRPLRSPYTYIAKLLKSLHVKQIDFRNANFKYVNNNGPVPDIDSAANLNVTLKDWLIDPQSADDPRRLYLLKDIEVDLSNYSYASPDSMYHVNVAQLSFVASSKRLTIKEIALVPRYDEANFAKVNGYARDRFSVSLKNLDLHGMDLPAYIRKQDFIASKMDISGGVVAVHNDNRLPKKEQRKIGRFPHQLLQQLRLRLAVEKINLSDIDVSYAEFDRESNQVGKITFEKTKGSISNVTNIPERNATKGYTKADLVSYVMGQGRLHVVFDFDINSTKGDFGYRGALTNLDGKTLNRITKPLGMVQVNRGEIKELKFDIRADEDIAKRKLEFRYKDLSVALLKKEAGKERLVRQGLISFLANNLVIYSDNPSTDGKFTTATIHYRREITASFFSYIWKSLFQGVKYSVGVTPRKEAEIKAQIARFEKMKADRDHRKWRRQQRRDSQSQ